jgi:hypothetical protein
MLQSLSPENAQKFFTKLYHMKDSNIKTLLRAHSSSFIKALQVMSENPTEEVFQMTKYAMKSCPKVPLESFQSLFSKQLLHSLDSAPDPWVLDLVGHMARTNQILPNVNLQSKIPAIDSLINMSTADHLAFISKVFQSTSGSEDVVQRCVNRLLNADGVVESKRFAQRIFDSPKLPFPELLSSHAQIIASLATLGHRAEVEKYVKKIAS